MKTKSFWAMNKKHLLFSFMIMILIYGCAEKTPRASYVLQSTINVFSDSLHKPWAGAVFSEGKIYTYHTSLKDSLGKTLFTDSMRYEIGSSTKFIVGIAIMKLYEQGKISFEDPIATYFSKEIVDNISKDSSGKSYGDQIKVYHLLNHTSGIYNYLSDESKFANDPNPVLSLSNSLKSIEKKSTRDNVTENTLRELVFTKPHYFKPGEGWEYSNTNYNLLTEIIKKITGEDYKVFIQKNILDVAGMQHTSFGSLNPDLQGNYPGDALGKPTVPINYMLVMGAGEIISTPKDMCMLAKALFENKILKKETFDFFIKNKYLVDTKNLYYKKFYSLDIPLHESLANFTLTYKGKNYYGHGGNTFGFSGSLVLDIEHQRAAYVVNNRINDEATGPLSMEILNKLQQQ